MKKIFIFLLFFCGCITYPPPPDYIVLGAQLSNQTWVYFCGLLQDFIPDYMEELKVLDNIGKKLDIKFLVVIPKHRCSKLENRLCWPQDTKEEVIRTYQETFDLFKDYIIDGYIGFSNGGFFLDLLAQVVELKKPIISIGAAGFIFDKNGPKNNLYLLIGKKDQWHYNYALEFYKQSKESNLKVTLIEYEEGHSIPVEVLESLLISVKS